MATRRYRVEVIAFFTISIVTKCISVKLTTRKFPINSLMFIGNNQLLFCSATNEHATENSCKIHTEYTLCVWNPSIHVCVCKICKIWQHSITFVSLCSENWGKVGSICDCDQKVSLELHAWSNMFFLLCHHCSRHVFYYFIFWNSLIRRSHWSVTRDAWTILANGLNNILFLASSLRIRKEQDPLNI